MEKGELKGIMKYKKEIEYLYTIKRQLELGKLITPEKAKQFQKDIEMYNRIIKILESK